MITNFVERMVYDVRQGWYYYYAILIEYFVSGLHSTYILFDTIIFAIKIWFSSPTALNTGAAGRVYICGIRFTILRQTVCVYRYTFLSYIYIRMFVFVVIYFAINSIEKRIVTTKTHFCCTILLTYNPDPCSTVYYNNAHCVFRIRAFSLQFRYAV